ncbi:THO complex subunit 5 protein [Echinococcus multilocularis]|uniref:THO complex subunit 5 protein n=1 Tax=Echinococcus multilocularis TaxID=6211 RepID=A0A087W260_ECHMU|nr:THO complex subunit 5 protein [Echinococcus multilocularis]
MDGGLDVKKLVNDGKLDLKLFKQECSALKSSLDTTWQRKKSKQSVSGSTFGKHIIALKAINRRTQLRIKDLREATYQKKLAVDQKTRELQNLLYELEHLKESIQTCLGFRSLHEEISLIPVEEYAKTVCTSEACKSEHQQTLERLYWELQQRKKLFSFDIICFGRLHSNLNEISKSMAQVKEKIATKQAYLDRISGNLRNILESTRALDSEMGFKISENEETFQSAFALPPPLYIIYSKLSAYIDVKNLQRRVTVKIVGDSELARSVNSAASSNVDEVDADSSEVDDQDGLLLKRKKTHRKSKRIGEEDEERPQHKTDSPHPLSVVVHIATGSDAKWANLQLTLTFTWLMRARLVTVKEEFHEIEKLCPLSQTARDLLSSEGLLAHLQCGGEASRWEGGEAVAGGTGPASFLPLSSGDDDSGRAYAWAQHLGGLQCLPYLDSARDTLFHASTSSSVTASSSATSVEPFGFIDSWFTALCRRLESRMSLNAEIHAIESGVLNLSENQKPFFPISKDICLSTWDRVTFKDISTWPRAQTFIALDLIQPSDAIFKCQMAFRGKDVLTIGASIPASYPDDPSLIFLASETDAFPAGDLTAMHIQEMETEVNCYWREMPCEDGRTTLDEAAMGVSEEIFTAGSTNKLENLLTCQLARIASCLPIFLTKDDLEIKTLCPQGGVRYRTRSRPLKFLPRLGVFTFR